jgi:hypothetical protein
MTASVVFLTASLHLNAAQWPAFSPWSIDRWREGHHPEKIAEAFPGTAPGVRSSGSAGDVSGFEAIPSARENRLRVIKFVPPRLALQPRPNEHECSQTFL